MEMKSDAKKVEMMVILLVEMLGASMVAWKAASQADGRVDQSAGMMGNELGVMMAVVSVEQMVDWWDYVMAATRVSHVVARKAVLSAPTTVWTTAGSTVRMWDAALAEQKALEMVELMEFSRVDA